MNNKILLELKNVLSKCDKYLDENNEILKSKVQSDVLGMNEELISILLNNEILNKTFFKNINGVLVFDKVSFSWTINSSEFLPNSFTTFKKNIGLIDENNNFIKDNNNVSLSFPYKDCVLEFDSTSESEQRDEVYLNQMLCKNDIDSIFEPKIFTNAIKHTINGNSTVDIFQNENLIIKGNNLISMYSLLPRYGGKIKCMYWDILYNTNSDLVPYNDSFKHSSWLLMMKNRLEVAKLLLKNDGCIFLQCDDNEQAYLKVLCDEIFGRENFVNCITVKMSEATGVKMSHANKRFPKLKEYILFYKMKEWMGFYEIDKYPINTWDNENNIFLENFTFEDRKLLISIQEKEFRTEEDLMICMNILKNVKKISLSKKISELKIKENKVNEWLFENSYRIIKTCGSTSLYNLVKKQEKIYDQEIACALSKENILFFFITDYNKNSEQPRLRVIFADENIYKNPCDFWQDIKTTGAISNEGGVALSNGKKPEKILLRLIKMCTKENDLILDAYFGTGTTGAVAMKMGRKFIGLEQLDSHYKKAITRLENVINGDSTGISKEINWQGGGEYISCELLKQNELWIDMIKKAEKNNIDYLYNELLNYPFVVNYKVNLDLMKTVEIKEEFYKLSLEDKKKVLITLINKNNLYVNYFDKYDKNLNVSENDVKFSKSFYGEN